MDAALAWILPGAGIGLAAAWGLLPYRTRTRVLRDFWNFLILGALAGVIYACAQDAGY